MRTKMKNQIKKIFIMKGKETRYYRNKNLDKKNIRNYIDPMLNFKINSKH